MPDADVPLQTGQKKVMDECWREKEVTGLGVHGGVVLEGAAEENKLGQAKKV